MSSTAEPEAGSVEDQAYFRALEEKLIELRGSTTLLSPADWQVAAEWRRRGIPLELVGAVMAELALRQRARRSKRGFSSLRYFRAAVEAAWHEQLELGAGGVAPRFDPGPPVEARLEALAAALPPETPRVWRDEILGLTGPLEEVEAALVELDRRLLESVAARLVPAARTRIARRVEAAARGFEGALPEAELAALRERLRAQALRAEAGLPLLSLFAAEALEPARDG
jgi:hypothetical protein